MGLLDELEGIEEQEAKPLDAETNNSDAPQVEPDSFVECAELEVAGMVMDDYGNKWQVAGDNVADLDDLYAGDVYKMPKALTDKFFIQMIRVDELREYMLRHFVPVLQEELEIPKELIKDMGNPLDRYHVVGDSIMVKIPHEIRNRLELMKTKETKDRLLNLEPTPEMLRKAGIDSGMTIEHKLGFTAANPADRQGIFADAAGNRK